MIGIVVGYRFQEPESRYLSLIEPAQPARIR